MTVYTSGVLITRALSAKPSAILRLTTRLFTKLVVWKSSSNYPNYMEGIQI